MCCHHGQEQEAAAGRPRAPADLLAVVPQGDHLGAAAVAAPPPGPAPRRAAAAPVLALVGQGPARHGAGLGGRGGHNLGETKQDQVKIAFDYLPQR